MRRWLIFINILLAIIHTGLSAQEKQAAFIQSTQDSLYCIFEMDAAIDMPAWRNYLLESCALDSLASDSIPAGVYTVLIGFEIDRYGAIVSVKVLREAGYGLATIAAGAIRNYKGRWKPAERNGRPVRSYRTQPVTFVIDSGDKMLNEEQGLL